MPRCVVNAARLSLILALAAGVGCGQVSDSNEADGGAAYVEISRYRISEGFEPEVFDWFNEWARATYTVGLPDPAWFVRSGGDQVELIVVSDYGSDAPAEDALRLRRELLSVRSLADVPAHATARSRVVRTAEAWESIRMLRLAVVADLLDGVGDIDSWSEGDDEPEGNGPTGGNCTIFTGDCETCPAPNINENYCGTKTIPCNQVDLQNLPECNCYNTSKAQCGSEGFVTTPWVEIEDDL